MIGGVTQTTRVSTTSGPAEASATGAASSASLLPSPADVPSDPLSMLYYCESKQQQLATNDGQKHVESLQSKQAQAFKDEQTAIQKEVDAAQHKSFWDQLGSTFGEVAKAAAAVASIAAAVATVGAATPLSVLAISGAVLSTAGFADGELHVLKQLGVSDKMAGIVDAVLGAAGGGASLGAAAFAGTTTAAVTATTVVGGVAVIGASASQIGTGLAQAADDRATADETAAQADQDTSLRMAQQTLSSMKDSAEAADAYLNTITQTKTTQNDTMLDAAKATGGVGS